MAGKQTAVLGIYPDYASVEKAVDVLKVAGFRNKDISVLFPEKAGSKASEAVTTRQRLRRDGGPIGPRRSPAFRGA
jgi:hypothetical protein